jgi:hypothetical protein
VNLLLERNQKALGPQKYHLVHLLCIHHRHLEFLLIITMPTTRGQLIAMHNNIHNTMVESHLQGIMDGIPKLTLLRINLTSWLLRLLLVRLLKNLTAKVLRREKQE